MVRTVIVEEPEVLMDGGLKVTVVLAGSPLTLRATVPLNPLVGVTGIV